MKFSSLSIAEKIKFCIEDVEEFKDLIGINNSDIEIFKRYKIAEDLSGAKVTNRFENLIIKCWNAKDYLSKLIEREIDKNAAKVFESNILNNDAVNLIQYLANSTKHDGIDIKKSKQNKFLDKEPRLENILLTLSNQSVPGEMKPFFQIEDSCLPSFEVKDAIARIDGQEFPNYDTIYLTIKIVDKDNKIIGDVISLVNTYLDILNKEFNRIMRC